MDRSLELRAQEIVENSPTNITQRDAYKRAIVERYGDDVDAIVGALADTGKSLAKAAVKVARDIADPDQVPMFDAVPSHFPVMLPEHGLTWMTKDDPATLGKHVKQFARETHRFGEQVARRGKRLVELVEPLADDQPAGDQMRALDLARRDELAQQ